MTFQNGSVQNLSNLLWAYATLSYPIPEFRIDVGWLLKGRVNEIVNVLWSLGKVGDGGNFFRVLKGLEGRLEVMEKGGGQEWSNLIYSMGVKRVYSKRILGEFDERMEWFFEVGKPQEISNVIYALSYLGQHDYKLINGVEYNTQECCNVLYAISISGKIYETGEEEVNRLIDRIQWEEVTREGVNQINVFRCFAECEGVEVKLVKEVLEEGFRSKQSEGSKSFENEVCKELERWGYRL